MNKWTIEFEKFMKGDGNLFKDLIAGNDSNNAKEDELIMVLMFISLQKETNNPKNLVLPSKDEIAKYCNVKSTYIDEIKNKYWIFKNL